MQQVRAAEHFPELDREEEIDGRVAIHDSDHVEVKLDCRLGAGAKSRYRVETYFFVPASLGLNENSYTRQHFYNDVQTYIRFKTPSIPLATLADPSTPKSPLAEIRRLLERSQRAPKDTRLPKQLSYELRMFCCVARARLRDRVRAVRDAVARLPAHSERYDVLVADIAAMCERFADELDQLLAEWRHLRAPIMEVTTHDDTRDMYLHADEYISLVVEENITLVVRALDRSEFINGQVSNARGRFIERLMAERAYRRGAGYDTAESVDDGELFVYRRSLLKKLVTSVLWLEVDKQHRGKTVGDVTAAFAAGVAMLFAVLATIFATQMWMINTSAFVAAAVVTYMFKDRMKDWLKRYFSRRISRLMPDYNVNIRDPMTGEHIGSSRESFGYVSHDRVPDAVRELRHAQSDSEVAREAKKEVVLRYDKEIRVHSKEVIQRMHLADYDVNDITRFALWQMLIRGDDPKYAIPMYDAEDDKVRKRSFRRVYHLNIVMVFHAGTRKQQTTTMRHLRVIFDKHKIRRLEHVTG